MRAKGNSIMNHKSGSHGMAPADSELFFDNLPELVRPEVAATALGLSVKTIYDWRYRQKQLRVPEDLFVKFNRFLYLKTPILRHWITSQNSSAR